MAQELGGQTPCPTKMEGGGEQANHWPNNRYTARLRRLVVRCMLDMVVVDVRCG